MTGPRLGRDLDLDALRFDERGLLTAVCQDAATGEVLMVAWQSRAALEQTLTSGRATFWSRSRGELWEKGATSGNVLEVVRIRPDCDGDAVLLEVVPRGPACHTGALSCFGADGGGILAVLRETIASRRGADPEGSYTARLLHGPRAYVERKVGEEAVETITERADSERIAEEAADLVFHLLALLAHDGRDPLEPLRVLAERHRPEG
jgi:phosphoribosyl-ATP pyrophosphohydrolase/phosphoribosyl-AMP cyclohydrolase